MSKFYWQTCTVHMPCTLQTAHSEKNLSFETRQQHSLPHVLFSGIGVGRAGGIVLYQLALRSETVLGVVSLAVGFLVSIAAVVCG